MGTPFFLPRPDFVLPDGQRKQRVRFPRLLHLQWIWACRFQNKNSQTVNSWSSKAFRGLTPGSGPLFHTTGEPRGMP